MDKTLEEVNNKILEVKKAILFLDQYEKHWPDFEKKENMKLRLLEELELLKRMIEKKPL